jgi:hypothetical protein
MTSASPSKKAPVQRKALASPTFSQMERAFFAAGSTMGRDIEEASPPSGNRMRRSVLRLTAIVVLAAAGVLAWQGPVKAAVPRIASMLQPAAAARSGSTARATEALQAPRATSKALAAAPGPRPAPHPATAARQRGRHR